MAALSEFQVVPGDGVGWYCLGDRLNTTDKCETSGEVTTCRYFVQAVERYYERGVLTRIRVHRRDRRVPPAFQVGQPVFRPPGYLIGFRAPLGKPVGDLLPALPAPLKVAPADDPDFGPIVRYTFPGLELEIEKVNDRDVVGALVVLPRQG